MAKAADELAANGENWLPCSPAIVQQSGCLQVVGGTDPDYKMSIWRPFERVQYPNEGTHFDMQRPVRLKGHSGPISALALDHMYVFWST